MAASNSTPRSESALSDTERFVPATGFAVAWLKSFDPHEAPDLTDPARARHDLGDRPELGDRCNAGKGLRAIWGRSGQVSFIAYITEPRKKVTIGPWGETGAGLVSLAQGRDWTRRLRYAAKQGRLLDELHELEMWRNIGKGSVTKVTEDRGEKVKAVYDAWMKRAIEPQRDAAGRIIAGRTRPEKVRETMERFVIPYIGDRFISEITEREAAEIIEHILGLRTKRAPTGARSTAQHTLHHMKQMWKWAKATGRITGENRLAAMTPALFQLRTGKRKRVATNEELSIIWNLLEIKSGNGRPVVSETVALAYRLLILLGVRSQEIRLNTWDRVEWGDKDGEGATLTVPVDLQKGDVKDREEFRDWVVPLPPAAVAILRRLRAITPEGSPWILTSPKHQTSPLERTTLPATIFDLAKKGILPTPNGRGSWVHPHDLRRTFRTGITRLTSSEIAERCLNHVLPDMEAIYNQHDYLGERREALEEWAEHVLGIVHGGDDGGGVVPLVRKKRRA